MKNLYPAPHRITRRQLAGAMVATAAAAQTPPSTPSTAPPAPPGDLEAAREQNQRNAEALAKVDLPAAAEPAFHFTA
jgi:hypothetical protein